ncbi:hypothetical protein ACLMJK_009077 [Lecanora helva]
MPRDHQAEQQSSSQTYNTPLTAKPSIRRQRAFAILQRPDSKAPQSRGDKAIQPVANIHTAAEGHPHRRDMTRDHGAPVTQERDIPTSPKPFLRRRRGNAILREPVTKTPHIKDTESVCTVIKRSPVKEKTYMDASQFDRIRDRTRRADGSERKIWQWLDDVEVGDKEGGFIISDKTEEDDAEDPPPAYSESP